MAERDAAAGFSILVGVDFEEAGGYALEQAARIAIEIPSAQLHVLHVLEAHATEDKGRQTAYELRTYVNTRAGALGGLHGLRVGLHVRVGNAAEQVALVSRDVGAKLIILGSGKGSQLKSLFVGGTAEKVVLQASCPVFVAGPRPAHAPAAVPTIEPPCPDCLRVRGDTAGARWWCDRHSEHHVRAHAYSYQRELPFATHDSEVVPTGIPPEEIR